MFVDLFTIHRRSKQGLWLSISTPTAEHYQCERENPQRAFLSVASSLLHATNEKTVYVPPHSNANCQTRPVLHVDQVVSCTCCTVYSQSTCPLSNPDNLFRDWSIRPRSRNLLTSDVINFKPYRSMPRRGFKRRHHQLRSFGEVTYSTALHLHQRLI